MNWRLPAAVLGVAILLVGLTVLVSQTEADLSRTMRERDSGRDEPRSQAEDSAREGLKLKNLTIPKELLAKIPPEALAGRDLSRIHLPEGMTLELPPDFPLENVPFSIPEGATLDLPAGTSFDPPSLSLPKGGQVTLPDASSFKLPPGTKVNFPPDLAKKLLEQGFPAGELPDPRSLTLPPLPEGSGLSFTPPPLPDGGTLELPPGTDLVLPNGQKFPFRPGELGRETPFMLPPGTTFAMPPLDALAASGDVPDVPIPFPEGAGSGAEGGATKRGRPTFSEIDQYDSKLRKGEPFRVGGRVVDLATGKPVAGVDVDVYVNETKTLPGTHLGAAKTDASGRFSGSFDLPPDKPARAYQLVAHAHESVDADGVAHAGSWSDPEIQFTSATKLALDTPASDGVGAEVPVGGTLTDVGGAPVPFARVSLRADGRPVEDVLTAGDGTFLTTLTFQNVGPHEIVGVFGGDDHHEASRAAARIEIREAAISVPPTVEITPGVAAVLEGTVLESGRPKAGTSVAVEVLGRTGMATTREDGRFAIRAEIPRNATIGNVTITYRAPDLGVTKSQNAVVALKGTIVLEAPPKWDASKPARSRITVLDPAKAPIPAVAVQLQIAGPGGGRTLSGFTGPDGTAVVSFPAPGSMPGAYSLTASATGQGVRATPAKGSILFGKVTSSVRAVEPEDARARLVRGEPGKVQVSVSFEPGGFETTNFTLAFFESFGGTIGSEEGPGGRVLLDVRVPKGIDLGPAPYLLTVPALGHEGKGNLDVAARPRVTLEAPGKVEPGGALDATARLVDDTGRPLSAELLTLSSILGSQSSTTGAGGQVVFPVTPGTFTGSLTMTARYPGDATRLPASAQTDLVVAEGKLQSLSAYLKPVAYVGVPLLGLAAAVSAALFFLRHRRRERAKNASTAPAEPEWPTGPAPILEFPDLPPGGPPVWGVNEPLRIRLRAPDGYAVASLQVEISGRVLGTVELEDGRETEAAIAVDVEGEHRVVARSDVPGLVPGGRALRIVNYRREISREFDVFLERARLLTPAVGTEATPREVEWALAPILGGGAARPLADVALGMEMANWSERPVGRPDYLAFVDALRRVDPALSRAAEAAASAKVSKAASGGEAPAGDRATRA